MKKLRRHLKKNAAAILITINLLAGFTIGMAIASRGLLLFSMLVIDIVLCVIEAIFLSALLRNYSGSDKSKRLIYSAGIIAPAVIGLIIGFCIMWLWDFIYDVMYYDTIYSEEYYD
jgi:hypothetical protein